ncbi:hypothetical protein HDU85_000066 [Gaertneriomyces sp. JEL0708]|nr:hypothetical protein HDU85_000066 [Gaertneriomyces sp. JEL0708]
MEVRRSRSRSSSTKHSRHNRPRMELDQTAVNLDLTSSPLQASDELLDVPPHGSKGFKKLFQRLLPKHRKKDEADRGNTDMLQPTSAPGVAGPRIVDLLRRKMSLVASKQSVQPADSQRTLQRCSTPTSSCDILNEAGESKLLGTSRGDDDGFAAVPLEAFLSPTPHAVRPSPVSLSNSAQSSSSASGVQLQHILTNVLGPDWRSDPRLSRNLAKKNLAQVQPPNPLYRSQESWVSPADLLELDLTLNERRKLEKEWRAYQRELGNNDNEGQIPLGVMPPRGTLMNWIASWWGDSDAASFNSAADAPKGTGSLSPPVTTAKSISQSLPRPSSVPFLKQRPSITNRLTFQHHSRTQSTPLPFNSHKSDLQGFSHWKDLEYSRAWSAKSYYKNLVRYVFSDSEGESGDEITADTKDAAKAEVGEELDKVSAKPAAVHRDDWHQHEMGPDDADYRSALANTSFEPDLNAVTLEQVVEPRPKVPRRLSPAPEEQLNRRAGVYVPR